MTFDKPKIMGILNLTPDSFSHDGIYSNIKKAQKRVFQLLEEGADIIDVGAESTRPGSTFVSLNDELLRIKPVVDSIACNNQWGEYLFSIDTYKSQVAEYALLHGFQIINDVTALRGDHIMRDVLIKYRPYIVLMYAKDKTPRTTRRIVHYDDVVNHIKSFLVKRINLLLQLGFPKEKIIIDPGFGLFVSSEEKYSFEILSRLAEFKDIGCPILLGISRKMALCKEISMEKRDARSAELGIKAIENGASVIRTHNVKLLRQLIC